MERRGEITVVEVYREIMLPGYGISFDFVFSVLWDIYRKEQPIQASGITVNDLLLPLVSKNGLLFIWLVLELDYPNKSKEERLLLFRQLARQGKVEVILAE